MEKIFDAEKALATYNRQARVYFVFGICLMYFLILTSILIVAGRSEDVSFLQSLKLHAGFVAVTVFFLISNTRFGHKHHLQNRILFRRRRPKSFTMSYFVRASLRAFSSFLLFFLIAFIPLIIMVCTQQPDLGYYAKNLGLLLVVASVSFFVCYGVIMLPNLIETKTGKKKYKYIYWFYFIKGRMTTSGFTLYIGIPIFLIIVALSVFATHTFNEVNQCIIPAELGSDEYMIKSIRSYINSKNILEIERFSLLVTSFAIWLSMLSILISDILRNYLRLNAVFEDYTSYLLRERLLYSADVSHILIGYNNLIKRSLIQLIKNIVSDREASTKPSNYFELVIDRQFDLRFISRKTAVIEPDSGLFEEFRKDTHSGLKFGFFNTGELSLRDRNVDYKIPEMATFGIVGDAGDVSIMKFAGIYSAELVINASDQVNMGFDLKRMLEEYRTDQKPVLITTVKDSASFSFLEMNNKLAVFPLNPLMTEGIALGSRLFMFMNKYCNKFNIDYDKPEKLPKVIFLGRGKSVYYALKQFTVNALATHVEKSSIKKLIHENFVIVSDDVHLQHHVEEDKHEQLHWLCELGHGKTISPKLSHMAPDYYDSIKIALKLAHNEKAGAETADSMEKPAGDQFNEHANRNVIFVIAPKHTHEGIRITYNVKQLICEHPNYKSSMIACIELKWINAFKEIIKNIQAHLVANVGKQGFPKQIDDYIIKKDVAAGSQISSLMECLNKEKPDAAYRRFYDKKQQIKVAKTGVIAICANDLPGILLETLGMISGISGIKPSVHCKYLPNFYYSYSYRLGNYDPKWHDTFIIRGDCYLSSFEEEDLTKRQSHLNGLSMNGTQAFMDTYGSFMKTEIYDKGGHSGCGFHPLCPVSNNNAVCANTPCETKSGHAPKLQQDANKTVSPILASVKIWADYDSVPGSLATALSNFLMMGSDMHLQAEEDDRPLMNIVYEQCNACTQENLLTMRFFTKEADLTDENVRRNRLKLITKTNIIGIKIRLSATADKAWKDYFERLKLYTLEQSGYHFEAIEFDDELQLFNREIRSLDDSRAFFETL